MGCSYSPTSFIQTAFDVRANIIISTTLGVLPMRYLELLIHEKMIRLYAKLCKPIPIRKIRYYIYGKCQYNVLSIKRIFESKSIYQDRVSEIYGESTVVAVYLIQQITIQMKMYCQIYAA